MQPAIGWTLLSKDALSRAETQLRDDVLGVRDEIGVLAIHSAYADRFFPGTSVLHTRLRYIFFVPWLYRDAIRSFPGSGLGADIVRREVELAGRLQSEDGTIGKRSYPEPTVQPPSFAYWTALGRWRLLRSLADGSTPSRSQIHRAAKNSLRAANLLDDDRKPLEERDDFFVSLPTPPPEWGDHSKPLNFVLSSRERDFAKRILSGVMRGGEPGTPSLLARLTDGIGTVDLSGARSPWDTGIRRFADPADAAALDRAKGAAALAGVVRAVYPALLEDLKEQEGSGCQTEHREHLDEVRIKWRKDALKTDVDAIRADVPGLPQDLAEVLKETSRWLMRGGDFRRLREPYRKAELRRKSSRARLDLSLVSRKRREEWVSEDNPLAEKLHYRWQSVRQLLLDLQNRHHE